MSYWSGESAYYELWRKQFPMLADGRPAEGRNYESTNRMAA